jgi:hypothetical protein
MAFIVVVFPLPVFPKIIPVPFASKSIHINAASYSRKAYLLRAKSGTK